jgi:hypothetical protein
LPLDEFMRIRQLQRPARAPAEPIGLQVLRHDRSPTGGMEIFDRGEISVKCGRLIAVSALFGGCSNRTPLDAATAARSDLRRCVCKA